MLNKPECKVMNSYVQFDIGFLIPLYVENPFGSCFIALGLMLGFYSTARWSLMMKAKLLA